MLHGSSVVLFVLATLWVQDVGGQCLAKKQWPTDVQLMCGHLLYPASRNSSFEEVVKKESVLRPLVEGTGMMSAECELALRNAVCTANIVGCTEQDLPFQACSQHCEDFMERCSAPLEAVRVADSLNFPLLDCFKWTSPLTSCSAFERREPCLTPLQATTSSSSLVAPQSWCSRGPPATTSKQLITEARRASTESYELVEREISYIVWPATFIISVCASLAFTSVMNNNAHERGGTTFNIGERALSLRFCTQIISIILASGSCMIVFFVSTSQAAADLKLSFSSARETQERTFITADASISTLSDKLLEQTALHTETHFDRFLSIVEARHVQMLLDINGAPTRQSLLQSGLLSMDSFAQTKTPPFAIQVVAPDNSFVRIVHSTQALSTLGFVPPPQSLISHIGFTNVGLLENQTVRPATYDVRGVEVVAGVASEDWVKVSLFDEKWFIIPSGEVLWLEPTMQLGHATMAVVSTVYHNSVPLYTMKWYVYLETISDTLKDKVQYYNERIVIALNTSEETVLAASHGTLIREGRMVSIHTLDDPITVTVMKSFLDVTNSTTIRTVPTGVVFEVDDFWNETYAIQAYAIKHLSIEAVAVVMVPIMEVQGSMIMNTLELRGMLDAELNRVRENEKDSHRFLILVSVMLVFLALLLSLVASHATTTALMTMIIDLQDIAHLRLEAASNRQKTKQLSKLLEVRALQIGLRKTVAQLSEYRKYFPSAVMGMDGHKKESGEARGSDEEEQESLNGSNGIIDTQERTCTVHVIYISRNLEKKQAGTGEDLISITKKSKAFEWHYHDPNHASLTSLQRECRIALGELVGEPLELSAIPPPDSDDEEDNFITYPLRDSHHLQDFLVQYPDEITIHVKKSGKANLLSPLTALASVMGKMGLVSMVWNMYTGGDSIGLRLAPVQVVILIVGFTLNILWGFKLNRKANKTDEQMAEWTRYFQTETTLVMVLCGFNLQNMLMLWSGLRVGKVLRFHAPMPRPIRHQAIRWSMFSLVVGDLLPLLVTMFFLSETDGWSSNLVAELTIAAQVVAILASSVKKFVVFCLVDDDKEEQEENAAQAQRDAKVRNARLMTAELTVIRVELADFYQVQQHLELHDLSKLLHAFYGIAMRSLRRHEGTVVSFSDGVLEGVFNYPSHASDHAKLGCCSAVEILLAPMPEPLQLLGRSQHSWVNISVVTDTFYKGNQGSNGRRAFHFIGKGTQLLRSLCRHCNTIGARAVVDSSIAMQLKHDAQHKEEFSLRIIDVVKVPGEQYDAEVFQLLPLPRTSPDAFSLLDNSTITFEGMLASLKKPVVGNGVDDAIVVLQGYLATAAVYGVRDVAAELLLKKLTETHHNHKIFPTILCECGATRSSEGSQVSGSERPSSESLLHVGPIPPMSPMSDISSAYPTASQVAWGQGRRRGDTVITNATEKAMKHAGSHYLNASVVAALLDEEDREGSPDVEETESLSEVRVGDMVEVIGLQAVGAMDYNGCKGRVIRAKGDQWVVHVMQTDSEVVFQGKNLRPSSQDVMSPLMTGVSPTTPMTNASFSSLTTTQTKDRHSRVIATASTLLGFGNTPKTPLRSPLVPPPRRRRQQNGKAATVAPSVNLN